MTAQQVFQLDAWKKRRPGFTLVELLVVIVIIGILAGMVMYTLAGAQQDAKAARTRGTIKKINDIILARWEEFRYRGVKINIPESFLDPYQDSMGQWHVRVNPREGARARLIVMRDVMRMELPDRYSDILYTPTRYRVAANTTDTDPSNDVLVDPINREIPGTYQMYRRKMVMQPDALTVTNPWPAAAAVGATGTLRPTIANQGAELLYQIVSASNYNGASALEYFRPTEIGDTDDDGFPEFIDAWGNPIRWIRWPAGISSPMNDMLAPDPMDPLKVDWKWNTTEAPWLLVPLVVSAGPDGSFDTVFDFDPSSGNACVDPAPGVSAGLICYATNTWTGATPGTSVYTTQPPYYFPNPYVSVSGVRLGQAMDLDGDGIDGSTDNISNYELLLQ